MQRAKRAKVAAKEEPERDFESGEGAWLVKSQDEETDDAFGLPPERRSIPELAKSSVVIVDKHPGPTSHQVTAWVGQVFCAEKSGHSGTLDPGVSGVLPVALGEATKIMSVMLGSDKEYVGVMRVHGDFSEDFIKGTVAEFVGKIKQLPPVKSAVARKMREREIHYLDVLEVDGRDVLFKVGCEAGTYIRKLCHDIGLALGPGSHMTELRRTRAGRFTEAQAHSLTDVKDAYEIWKDSGDERRIRGILMPIEHAVLHVKRVFIKDSAVDAVSHGAPLYSNGITRIQPGIARGDTVAAYTQKGELVAFGVARMDSEEMLRAKKDTAVRTDLVFMRPGTYPKTEKSRKSKRAIKKKDKEDKGTGEPVKI
jgi:H/ACA ribonucleoprotein complex subunit 4